LAIGVVQPLTSRANGSVPEDTAIMRYDDIEFAESLPAHTQPELVVRQSPSDK
jgi:DNA-binding LacI/PurR family transcriptional regulator